MSNTAIRKNFEFFRKRTLDTLETIAKRPDAAQVLAWRPGEGRAHIAWQIMHIAATDDRHLNVRMKGGEAKEPDYIKRFAGGSTPDENVPTIDEIRKYLTEQRAALLDHVATLDDATLETKPNEQAPWIYDEWFRLLAWHEAHHQGQVHLTFNLYKAAHGG